MIVDPDVNEHLIRLTPRYYPCHKLNLVIKDTANNTVTELTPTYFLGSGYKLNVSFSFLFNDETKYKITLLDTSTNEIVYKGLVLATTQVSQDYKLTNNIYNWS